MNWHQASMSLSDMDNKIKALQKALKEVKPLSRAEKRIMREILELNQRKGFLIEKENRERIKK